MTQVYTDAVLDIRATVDREHARVFRYLLYLGCDEHRAADLTQEAFCRLLDREFTYQSDAATAAWLRRTAANLFANERNRPLVVDLQIADAVWDQGLGGERATYLAALDHCRERLPPRSRLAIALRYEDGASRRSIAERLDLGVEAVKTLLRRIRAELATCIRRQMT